AGHRRWGPRVKHRPFGNIEMKRHKTARINRYVGEDVLHAYHEPADGTAVWAVERPAPFPGAARQIEGDLAAFDRQFKINQEGIGVDPIAIHPVLKVIHPIWNVLYVLAHQGFRAP